MKKIKCFGAISEFGYAFMKQRVGFLGLLALICLFSGLPLPIAAQEHFAGESDQQAPPGTTSPAKDSARTKIAEGEYAIQEEANGGAFGPFGEEVYGFHESWTLWRTNQGLFDVEGERVFESPRDVKHTNHFLVQLSRGLTALRMTEFAQLKWRPDSGPLTCEFLPERLDCSSGPKDPRNAIHLRIPMDHPFGLLWPISPFSLSGLTRQAERDLKRDTPVQLLSIEQPSANNPVQPTVLDGQLRYLGEEDIEAAGQKWAAYKFSLKVPTHPQFLIWTSLRGLLLALAIEHSHPNWPQEGMRLTHFEKWSDY